MKKRDVQIGRTYVAKVSGKLARVRILEESPFGVGWLGKSLETGRVIHVRSARRLWHDAVQGYGTASAADIEAAYDRYAS